VSRTLTVVSAGTTQQWTAPYDCIVETVVIQCPGGASAAVTTQEEFDVAQLASEQSFDSLFGSVSGTSSPRPDNVVVSFAPLASVPQGQTVFFLTDSNTALFTVVYAVVDHVVLPS